MLLFRITQFGLTGDASALVGTTPYNLLLHGSSYQGLNQQIFIAAYASVAAAKTAAAAIAKASLTWVDEGTIGSHTAPFST
jgi:hypothetical protein